MLILINRTELTYLKACQPFLLMIGENRIGDCHSASNSYPFRLGPVGSIKRCNQIFIVFKFADATARIEGQHVVGGAARFVAKSNDLATNLV